MCNGQLRNWFFFFAWVKQWGTEKDNQAKSVAVDSQGRAFIGIVNFIMSVPETAVNKNNGFVFSE